MAEDPDNCFWRLPRPKGRMMLAVQRFHADDRAGTTQALDEAADEFSRFLEDGQLVGSVTYDMWGVALNRAYFALDAAPQLSLEAATEVLDWHRCRSRETACGWSFVCGR